MTTFRGDVRVAYLLVNLVILVGCGGQDEPIPATDDLRNPDVYGSNIKSNVIPLLKQAQQTPARAAEIAGQLSELVEDYEKRPVGQHVAKYKSLRDGAQELKTLAESSSPDTNKKIDELLAVAQSLPGELKLRGDDLKGKSPAKDLDDR